jgi:stearoyl-CoA desaturase (delta-9 desaturase)
MIATCLGFATWLALGWAGLVVGFFWSTVLLYHGTFMINSVAHVRGTQRFATGDDSRNNWWLALITLGEGWHNNHHAYQSATKQGFRWWEVDLTYYVLKALSWTRMIHDLRPVPVTVVGNEQRLGPRIAEKVASQVAAGYPLDQIAQRVRSANHGAPGQDKPKSALLKSQPGLPNLDDVREWVQKKWTQIPAASLEDVTNRAYNILCSKTPARVPGKPEAS